MFMRVRGSTPSTKARKGYSMSYRAQKTATFTPAIQHEVESNTKFRVNFTRILIASSMLGSFCGGLLHQLLHRLGVIG